MQDGMTAEQIEAKAADWLAKRDGDAWTAQHQRELDAWLGASTAHRVAYLRLASAWTRADRLAALPLSKVPDARPAAHRFSVWRIAAGVLLAVGLASGVAVWQARFEGNDYRTAVGARETLSLADGSVLALNTATHVRVQVREDRRTVWLDEGEAYFEVAHDAGRPFVVRAGDDRVTVLGTKFAVRRDAGRLSVVVVEGRVQVDAGSVQTGAKRSLLARNEELVATPVGLQVVARTGEQVANELSWREGHLVFDQTRLADAAAQFNRYNARKLVVADPSAQSIRIGGRFDVGNVDSFARLMHQGFGLRVEESRDKIVISSARTGS